MICLSLGTGATRSMARRTSAPRRGEDGRRLPPLTVELLTGAAGPYGPEWHLQDKLKYDILVSFDCRPVSGNTCPQVPSHRVRLERWYRTRLKSATQTNSKATWWPDAGMVTTTTKVQNTQRCYSKEPLKPKARGRDI